MIDKKTLKKKAKEYGKKAKIVWNKADKDVKAGVVAGGVAAGMCTLVPVIGTAIAPTVGVLTAGYTFVTRKINK